MDIIKESFWEGRPLSCFGDNTLYKDYCIEIGGQQIHCGSYIEVFLSGKWHSLRVEKNSRYYFPELPGLDPVGLIARFPEAKDDSN